MAYLRKIPNYRDWIARFLDRGGKLRNRCTKIRYARIAKERADAKRKAQASAEIFELAYLGEQQRKAELRDTFNELLLLWGTTPPKSLTTRGFFAGWIEKQIPISNKDGFFEIQYDMIDSLSFSE